MVSRTPVHRLDTSVVGDGREARVMHELRDVFAEQLRIHELYAEELDVHPNDLRALELISLNNRDRLTMGRLAGLLRLSTGAVTGTVDRLEQCGLVKRVRDASDRRRVLLQVTERAELITNSFYADYVRRVSDVLEAFDDEELAACERFLGALALALADE